MVRGNVATSARPRDGLTRDQLIEMFRYMAGERLMAEIAGSPNPPARLFLIGIAEGLEAIAVGSCMALRRKPNDSRPDLVVGNYGRDVMGMSYLEILLETMGKAGSRSEGRAGPIHVAAPELGLMSGGGIVGEPLPLAAGFGFYAKYKGTEQVVITFFGDGASNNGLFHEGLNLASVLKLPVIFLCVNNLYAFTTPMSKSTSVKRISDRAASYSIPGVTVDGNDVLAVYDATVEAAERARAGEGPSLIECMTYRWVGPTETGEEKPRPEDEVEEAKRNDPLNRVRGYLLDEGIASEEDLEGVRLDLEREIGAAFDAVAAAPWPPPETIESGVYATSTGEAQ